MKPSREYSGMLYSLASEIRRDEGCVTKSAEQVEEAAERIDAQTITIGVLTNQRDELLQAKTSMTAQYHSDGATIKRLANQVSELLVAIKAARDRIAIDRDSLFECHKDFSTGTVTDELGMRGMAEYIDALMLIDRAVINTQSHGQPEKQANTEPCTKCNTPDLCREYGRACDFGLQLPETSVPALVFYPAGSLGEEVEP